MSAAQGPRRSLRAFAAVGSHGRDVMNKITRMPRSRSILLAMAIAGAAGCATDGKFFQPTEDDRLCAEARWQNQKGDPAWRQTVDRIQDKHTAWYCLNYLIAGDNGFIQGGP